MNEFYITHIKKDDSSNFLACVEGLEYTVIHSFYVGNNTDLFAIEGVSTEGKFLLALKYGSSLKEDYTIIGLVRQGYFKFKVKN